MKLTDLEIQMLKAICNSEYNDGSHPCGNHGVWFDNPFQNKQLCGGVCASLTTKKAAWFCDEGTRDHAMGITKEGFEALKEADPEYIKRFATSWDNPYPAEFYA